MHAFLDKFYMSRIGIRILIGQYLELRREDGELPMGCARLPGNVAEIIAEWMAASCRWGRAQPSRPRAQVRRADQPAHVTRGHRRACGRGRARAVRPRPRRRAGCGHHRPKGPQLHVHPVAPLLLPLRTAEELASSRRREPWSVQRSAADQGPPTAGAACGVLAVSHLGEYPGR